MNYVKGLNLSGAGNTFSVVWENSETDQIANRSAFVKQSCEKNLTDGFIFLSWLNESQHEVQWDFYNNDGSVAEMCGNATRCVGYFLKNQINPQLNSFFLKTIAGFIKVKILDDNQFCVTMTPPELFNHAHIFWCDTGVPHIIQELARFEDYKNLKTEARALRFHSDFLPRGTNVTFVQKTSLAHLIKAVSYERGVESFTQACGTGAMAAAFYNLMKFQQKETIVEMPGGTLKMNLQNLAEPTMTGPAVFLSELK